VRDAYAAVITALDGNAKRFEPGNHPGATVRHGRRFVRRCVANL
jgi:hypothetical protein